jgi:Outer membrane lipoprotein
MLGHCRTPSTNRNVAVVSITTAFVLLISTLIPARAEPVTNRILAGHQMTTKDGCSFLKINFNIRIRYISHFPTDRGDELRVTIRPIDPALSAIDTLTRRESLRAPDSKASPVKAIDFEDTRADGPMLTIQFLHPIAYSVGPGADFESIVIAMPDAKSKKPCKPEYPIGASGVWTTTVEPEPAAESGSSIRSKDAGGAIVLPDAAHDRAPGAISPAERKSAAAAMDDARAALEKQDYPQATQLLSKVLRYPEHEQSAEAQELLAITYQKNRQLSEAKAEYEDYLRRYPRGGRAESVRQQLAVIETVQTPSEEELRAAKQGGGEFAPGPTASSLKGSASQFFVRDDSFRNARDPSLPPDVNADQDQVHRNVLLSSLDVFGSWSNDQTKSKFRFSGTEEHQFGSDENEIVGVAALFLETTVNDWGTTARIGRQTRNTGGVLGRFDGALLGWQAMPNVRWNVVGGSPVARRKDEPFKDDKFFLGTSVDFNAVLDGLDLSLFAIQQEVRDVTDRQAIGAEFRYLDQTHSAFLTLDYDTHFGELNAAVFNGSWTLADKSVLSGAADYRKAPYLTSSNALQGQQAPTLFQLLKERTQAEIAEMALDRTPAYTSANIGYSFPLKDKLQLNLDATAAHIDGTIASFGVDAQPSTGNEFYYSAQLVGSDVFRDGDLFIAGMRFSDTQDYNMYAADIGIRFPLTPEWRINPRVLFTARDGKTTDLAEYSVQPALLVDYYLAKDLAFEVEAGARHTWREQYGVKANETDLFFTAGYRFDFNKDGPANCPGPPAAPSAAPSVGCK